MLKYFRRVFVIINIKTLIISTLAVISTLYCINQELYADFPLTLLATAIVFPIVFSISGAYKRREGALDDYATMKAHCRAIYFAARDWMETEDPKKLKEAQALFQGLLASCRTLFAAPKSEMSEHEDQVYKQFSKISRFIKKDLRQGGLASGEVSRCNQYLSKIISAFESMKHVYQYRTPTTLRAFSDFFITILPPLYGPYFAYISQEFTPGLEVIMPILFAVILVSLDNIQHHLENPFDQVGEDDISINAEKLTEKLALE